MGVRAANTAANNATNNATSARRPSLRSPVVARDLLLLLLAFTSGSADAVSYLGLGSVFISNMTGNTVLLGLALAQRQGPAALRSLVALVGYLAGVALGAAMVNRRKRRTIWPRAVTVALAVEFCVLLVFTVLGTLAGTSALARVLPLIALAAVPMGIQSVAVRALGVSGVTTTYITGTWTSLVSGLIDRLRRAWAPSAHPSGPRPSVAKGASLQASVVGVYLVAAVVGGIAELRFHLTAAALPTALVALVLVSASLRFRRAKLTAHTHEHAA